MPTHHRSASPPGAAARLAALAVVVLLLAACGAGAPQSAPTAEPEPDAVRMAVVGDSITDADSPDLPGGRIGPASWVRYAVGPQVEFVGGWARWGASTEQMAAEMPSVQADVLVILAGTNDAGQMDHEQIGANLVAIARAAGVDQVVLSSVPPLDAAPQAATQLNDFLQDFAAEQGWIWVDAAAGLRSGEHFAEGMADDGVHPTAQGAQVLGEAIGAAVREAGR